MKLLLSKSFKPAFLSENLYLVMIGGAGSGKSQCAARKIVYRCLKEGGHRFLIVRKVRATQKTSCVQLFIDILEENNIAYTFNRSDLEITFHNLAGKLNTLLFFGCDNAEKIKSIVGITGVWLEEMTELTRDEFLQLDLRLRGETAYYKQIICSLNPDEAAGAWIKDEFCFDDEPKTGPGKRPGSFVHHSTIEDNPIKAVRDEYTAKLEAIGDKTYYAIYRRGVWALAKGIIYTWDVTERPSGTFYDEIFYGLDFGYSVDPAALIRIYRKADEFWVEEVFYLKGLTNPDIASQIRAAGITGSDQIYADSAEPKSIAELRAHDLSVYPCEKGADSVRSGIDFLKGKTIHILQGNENIVTERRKYKYKEAPDGRALPVPVEFENHAMDAIRYGIMTHMKSSGWGISFV